MDFKNTFGKMGISQNTVSVKVEAKLSRPTKNWSLNAQAKIKYTKEPIIKKVDIEAIQILKSRDIDGERFLNFTELDLVQWGLKENQKKILMNCRNQIIISKPIITTNASPVTKVVTKRKSFKIQNKYMNQTMNNYKETATQIGAQPPLPSLSRAEINDAQKQSTRASLQCYIDMNKIKNMTVENEEYYLDANHKQEPIKCFTRPLCKTPESTNDLGDTSRNNLEKIFANPRPPMHLNSGVRKKNSLKQSLFMPKQETTLQNSEAKRRAPTPPIIATGDEYVEPTTSAPVFIYSVDEGQSEYEDPPKYSSIQTKNRTKKQVYSPSSGHTSDEDNDPFYDEPNHPSFKKDRQVSDLVNKVSIQNCPLPPIPKQNTTANQREHTWPALPPLPNEFKVLKPKQKPKIMPKPVKYKNAEKSEEIILNFNTDLDFDSFPPPPPGFLNSSEEEDVAEITETIWNVLDTSILPRPPVFTGIFEPQQIEHVKEMLSPVRTPTSDDDDSCNPNNFPYYRNTDRKGGMQLLQKISNLEDSTFLLRQSSNDSYYLGLTIFHENHYYHLGIKRDSSGKFYCEPFTEERIVKFVTLNDFVEYYTYNSLTVKSRNDKVVELYLKHPLPNYVF